MQRYTSAVRLNKLSVNIILVYNMLSRQPSGQQQKQHNTQTQTAKNNTQDTEDTAKAFTKAKYSYSFGGELSA
jgi:hypothetical protein